MEKILNYANPAWYAEGSKLSGRARLIEVLDDISDKIETEFPDDLDVQAELHHKATEIYQANGNYPKSLRHAERALEIRRVLFGDKNVEVAKDKYYLGAVYLKFLKINQSLKLHEEAAATFREIAPDNANLPFLLEDLGGIYRGHWREFDKSEKNFTEALEIFRQKDGEIHFNTARVYFELSWIFAEKGDFSKADEYFREGTNRLNQLPEANIKKRLPRFQAAFEQAKGNRRKAEKILEDFLAQTDENAASPNVKDAEELLEQFYGANENYEKSIQLQTKLIKNLNPNVPPDKIRIGFRKTKIALDFYRSGKNTEADAMFAEGYQIYCTVPAENFKIEYHNLVAECFIYQKRYEKAKLILEELLAFFRENLPPNHGQTLEHKKLLEKIEKAGSADSLSAAVQAKR